MAAGAPPARHKTELAQLLSVDDQRVWAHVTRSVIPIHRRHPVADDHSSRDRAGVASGPGADPGPTPVMSPRRVPPLAVGHGPGQTSIPVADVQTIKKIRRGKIACDATLDLHGLTLAQAHAALAHFVRTQSSHGARCVLVISGKGAPQARGRIKSELTHWLNAAPLRGLIWSVSDAPASQGGAGALYVMLKRTRA
jgi:DNA-nicking Smr family endonuclease